MVDADLRGIDSHGISMIPSYGARLTTGLSPDGTPFVVHDDNRACVVIDAAASLGHVPAPDAMALACDRARKFGVGTAAVRNSGHFLLHNETS